MTTQNFADMLATAKKGAGLITAGGVTLQCIAATHGVSKSGGDPQIVGSYKIIGGQFNGRTMKAWHTLKENSPASVMSFFEEMAAFGIPEQEIVAMGQPNDQAMAALAAKMVNKVVGADVYHQDDTRNPGKKAAWLQAFRVHTGPMPQAASNGAAPAPAPAPAGYPPQQAQPVAYPGQAPAPAQQYPPQQPYAPQQPVYTQPQVAAPTAPVYQPQQAPAPVYQQQTPAPGPVALQYPAQAQPSQAPVQQPQPQAPVAPNPVPGQPVYGEEPPF